jgi:hypothetical protein
MKRTGTVSITREGDWHVAQCLEEGSIRSAIVPRHREIAAGTSRSIPRQAGLVWDECERL